MRDGIDREWLRQAARSDPVRHAYALWDLDHEPIRARFVSYATARGTHAYLLIWSGDPEATIVHWVDPAGEGLALLPSLPPRPLVAVVPERMGSAVSRALEPATSHSLLRMVAEDPSPISATEPSPHVRAIGAQDAARLRAWGEAMTDPLARGYRTFDPAVNAVWAAFEGDRIVGAATAGVRLPEIWVLNAIYVDPDARGHGHGTALTAAGVAAAREVGARPTLYVREDNLVARRVYERLGFRIFERLAWIGAGIDRPP